MASTPFMVEDTDEDFFDKLVEDEFEISGSGPSVVDGVDSDELKAFSNLSIGEVVAVAESSKGEVGFGTEKENHTQDVMVSPSGASKKDTLDSKGSVHLVSSDSFDFNSVANYSDSSTLDDKPLNSSMPISNGSKPISVKEVQWSSFYANSDQNGSNGFGSYSDIFTDFGGSSVDPFAVVEDNLKADSYCTSAIYETKAPETTTSFSYEQQQDGLGNTAAIEHTTNGQDVNTSHQWENLYPGWRYDPSTGEWHQAESYDATKDVQGSYSGTVQAAAIEDVVSNQRSEVSYLHQTAQSVVGTVNGGSTIGTIAKWNQDPQGSVEYPAHMVFDPQYPGWYYDTITSEWRALESYTPAVLSTNNAYDTTAQEENASVGRLAPTLENSRNSEYGQVEILGSQGLGTRDQTVEWAGNHVQTNVNMWAPKTVAGNDVMSGFSENQENIYDSRGLVSNSFNQQIGFATVGAASVEQTGQYYGGNNGVAEVRSFNPVDNFTQHPYQPKVHQSQQMPISYGFYPNEKTRSYSHQPSQAATQSSYVTNEGRSRDGRPPHALVTFGFGGKLIVAKGNSSVVTCAMYGSKDSVGGSVSVLDLMDVVVGKSAATSIDACDYFNTLCQQSFPGPLVGGNVGIKELIKWNDERIANCISSTMNYRNGELLRLLLCLLKIACQHYGKLRSPFGADPSLKENDRPELAVAKLFASAKGNGDQFGYAGCTHCLQNIPSEVQLRATANEVQNLLVSGRAKEALQCAREGQLWGPAVILAAQLGDQFYVDTVRQMAHSQLVAGTPLRTLCLLIAGQPADVFATDNTTKIGLPGAPNMSQQQGQIGVNGMLNDWQENLAIIAANRTKGDELVLLHLGDCLWKERGEIIAAHICYLVAEANFESFSDSARLCLIGADHLRFPRTYANPEAIQRTEVYEYSTVLGNSQSILLPFQPYKLIYAHMLAEVGKLSEALKYCHAISKSLKTGRAPEVDAWKQLVLSLEERIRAHQQGGFSTNLAPGKLVGKLLSSFDRSIHRMIGPPPASMSAQNNEHDSYSVAPRVAASQSTTSMSNLMPSASMEPISEWTGESNKMGVPNRSISEPDFGRSPRQGSSKEASSSDGQSKTLVSGGPSRFGRIGSHLFQKTMGWVSKSRSDRQAKLGETNKFYYDEKLKRWVEEGAELPKEELPLPPPPTTTAVQNGMADYNIQNAFRSDNLPGNEANEIKGPAPAERSSGIPPIPPSSNQFSSRARMGVRSRYVDTFNKGGGTSTNLFQSPSVPVAKTGAAANAKFFVPTPSISREETVPATGESTEQATAAGQDDALFSSLPPPAPSSSMQRFSSMNNIPPTGDMRTGVVDNGSDPLSSLSRRTATWSGSFTDTFPPTNVAHMKLIEEASGAPPSYSLPNHHTSSTHIPKSSSFGEDLQEVEL